MDRNIFKDKKFLILLLLFVISVTFFLLSIPVGFSRPEFGLIERPKLTSLMSLSYVDTQKNILTERKLPKKMDVIKLKEYDNEAKTAVAIAKKIGFKSGAIGIKPFEWREGKRRLSIEEDLSEILFTDLSVSKASKPLSEKEIKDKANKYLKKVGLLKQELTMSDGLGFLESSGAHFDKTDSFRKATFVEAYFNYKFSESYVYSQIPYQPSITVILNKQGKVRSISYKNIEVEKKAEYPLKSVDEAIRDIKISGALVNSKPDSYDPFLDRRFSEIEVEDVYLSYYFDGRGKYLQPIYVFRGRGKASGFMEDVLIYVTAVEGKWLK